MYFSREKINNYYLYDTAVENVFINEFIPDAPGDFVKVYLFALMYADINVSISNEDIAKQLSLEVEDILAAWTFWESKGVIHKQYRDSTDRLHYKVEFVGLRDQIYGRNDKSKKKEVRLPKDLEKIMSDEELRQMYSRIEQVTGRLFHGKEPMTILGWIQDYGLSSDYIIYAYEYCIKIRGNSKLNYVGAVVREWAEKGLKTVDEIEAHLQENDNRHYLYKRVMKALGFMRNPTEEERRIMDTWFDDLSLSLDKVLEACKKTSGISNPNINYVNAVLTPKDKTRADGGRDNSGEGGIPSVIRSYDAERAANEAAAEERRQEVYKAVPRIKEIEDETRNISLEISKAMLSQESNAKTRISSLKSRYDALANEKAYLLTDNNYRVDYLDVKYTCPLCKDTGILDSGTRCACFSRKLDNLGKKV